MIDILSNFPKDYKGFCVEAGACDGIHLSRTLELEKLNWNCLCIEPNDIYYEKLKKNRRLTSNFALGDKYENNVPFYILRIRRHSEGMILHLEGVADREAAESLRDAL